MGAKCCCQDGKQSEVTLPPDAQAGTYPYAHGEGDAAGLAGMEEQDGEQYYEEDWRDEEGYAADEGQEPQYVESGAGAPDDEDQAKEKARLQSLVSNFAKKAVQGIPCTFFDQESGEWILCDYKLDARLDRLSVKTSEDGRELVECPVAAIQDIYSFAGDGPGAFPASAVKSLKPDERMLLVNVVCTSGDKELRFTTLEESAETLETFLECMRVLVVYARGKQG